MDDNYRYQLSRQPVEKPAKPSRLGLRHTGGEIVEVQGGHIVRSTGLKDRHSKVCTAKGPRDRRVRLSAHTAIQFYDVQDRLGYDRPSKAVDWLIKKAKAAIDELAELPPWTPSAVAGVRSTPEVNIDQNPDQDDDNIVDNQMGCSQNSRFLPESLDSVKSFFPATPAVNVNNNNNNNNNNMNFPPANNNNNNNNSNQDLKLSLQSFQDPITHHQPGNNIYFDGSGWPENGGFSGFVFNAPPTAIPTQTTPFLQPLFGQPTNNQLLNYISQRGPLQSSNSPPVRAWVDPLPFTGAGMYPHQTLGFNNPHSMPGFASGVGGFSGFDIPARIRGDDEEHDGLSDKPSSGSSDSRH